MKKKWIHVIFWAAIVIAYCTPLILALMTIFLGRILFWYDPARDFLLALNNLEKPTLIGPTAGIPGIFYGPYWIWLVSAGLIVSKDPQVVVFLILTLPYFIFLPFILFQYRKVFDHMTLLVIWILFMMTAGIYYATQPWNPYPVPLMVFLYVLLLFRSTLIKDLFKNILYVLGGGFLLGLIINFHISLGIGLLAGTVIYFLFDIILSSREVKKAEIKSYIVKKIYITAVFYTGFGIAFLPFFLFEVRHGFQQTQVALHAITNDTSVVKVTGLTHEQILQHFVLTAGKVFRIEGITGSVFGIVAVIVAFLYTMRKKIEFTGSEKKLAAVLFSLMTGLIVVYFSSKNPVWPYHFIGVEVLFVLALGVLLARISWLRYLFIGWVFVVVVLQVVRIATPLIRESDDSELLFFKEKTVQMIYKDAEDGDFTVFIYNPSIYTYDYSYLFRLYGKKDVPYNPQEISPQGKRVYLIIPNTEPGIREDFISYRTPHDQYKTTKMWKNADGSFVLKRERAVE